MVKSVRFRRSFNRLPKLLFRAMLVSLTILTAVFGYYYAALPVGISIEENTSFCGGGFSAAELRRTDNGYSYYLGAIPIKTADVSAQARPMVIPCGTPFGIKLKSDGVMVVKVGSRSPAEESGIKTGDVITQINGRQITSNDDISQAIQLCEDSAEIILSRSDSVICISCTPMEDESGTLKIGAWVRDSAAGIGTLTFYDPESGLFGGLGHAVSDITTGQTVPLSSGEITAAEIYDVVKGKSGEAGELCGTILRSESIGTLYANTQVGVFGRMECETGGEAVPIAFRQEVQCGEATILTTINGSQPQEYSIEIERINLADMTGAKSMVIRITDPQLIEQTGGIVRGMSGSPILQNGRLVGAVTHVLINEPLRGYAVFAESMAEQMNGESLP